MPVDYLPGREAELVTWVGAFNALINAGAESYGLTVPQASNYATLAADFVESYQLARADATRSPSNLIRKNRDKAILIAGTRQLAGIIQRFPGTTDAMRSELGLTVRRRRRGPGTIPRPADAPALVILRREGTGVLIRLRDATGGRRGRPRGVQGARVYSFAGDAPPAGADGWRLEGQATRAKVDVTFPAGTAPGTRVWFTACWYNPRGEAGPACTPVGTYIAGGSMPIRQAA